MDTIQKILNWILCLLSLVSGVVLILWPRWATEPFAAYGAVSPSDTSAGTVEGMNNLLARLSFVWDASLASGILGAVMFLAGIIYALASLRKWTAQKYVANLEFTDDSGGFTVAVRAIEQSLARSLQDLEEVYDMRVVIQAEAGESAGPVHILAEGSVYENNNLQMVQQKIRSRLQERFVSMVHMEEGVKYDVHIFRMIPPPKVRKPPETPPEKEEEGIELPFSGPKYPVENENENH